MGARAYISIYGLPDSNRYKNELLSIEEFKDAPILPGRALAWFYGSYSICIWAGRAPHRARRVIGLVKAPPADPDFSPLLASEHAGLPPLWMQVAGMDPLRDEALLYEKVLRTSGVQTKLHV